MRTANLGGKLGASGAGPRQFYWILRTSLPFKPGAKSHWWPLQEDGRGTRRGLEVRGW